MDKEKTNTPEIAKRSRDFHVLDVGKANCSPFTVEDKKLAVGEPYDVASENFDLYFIEKNPEYKEKMFLIRNYLENPNLFIVCFCINDLNHPNCDTYGDYTNLK